ncbi:MAG: SRPBCC family protein [Actinomycetota bacterium]
MTRASATVDGTTTASLVRAWEIATPLTPVGYYPKFGPLPAVLEVRDQTGAWDAAGQTRQLMLSDGGYVIEHLVQVDKPETFSYELSDFQKLFGSLVSGARAEWEFSEAPGGTNIRWTYTFRPRRGAGLVVGAIVRLFWGPYMAKVLPGIIAEVERRA